MDLNSVKQLLMAAFRMVVGFSFFMLYFLPLSAYRQISAGKDAIDAKLKSARDSLKMLTEEALAELKKDCEEQYKDTVKSVQLKLDISQHCVLAGDPNKATTMLLLLHGFPECWYTWKEVIPLLVNKGYFVVAPDLRGYGLTDAPMDVPSYVMPKLADDCRKVIRHVRKEIAPKIRKVAVVAHDWGGGPACEMGLTEPDVMDGLVLINTPHANIMFDKDLVKLAPWQLFRSWYMFVFQVPGLVEYIQRGVTFFSKANPANSKFARKLLTAAHANRATPMLNYYRTFFLNFSLSQTYRTIWKYGPFSPKSYEPKETHVLTQAKGVDMRVPLLQIWGTGDMALDTALAKLLEKKADVYAPKGCQVVYLDGVSHWVASEAPKEVAENVHTFVVDVVCK